MRPAPWLAVEPYRIRGVYGTAEGAFQIRRDGIPLKIIASCGMGWEHVSVSAPGRCPTWGEMHHVKELFWSDDECVVQYHPPKEDYVNCHPFVLHLWRPNTPGVEIPRPPKALV